MYFKLTHSDRQTWNRTKLDDLTSLVQNLPCHLKTSLLITQKYVSQYSSISLPVSEIIRYSLSFSIFMFSDIITLMRSYIQIFYANSISGNVNQTIILHLCKLPSLKSCHFLHFRITNKISVYCFYTLCVLYCYAINNITHIKNCGLWHSVALKQLYRVAGNKRLRCAIF